VIEKWAKRYGLKYHELYLDKPKFDVLIDDRAINARDWREGRYDGDT